MHDEHDPTYDMDAEAGEYENPFAGPDRACLYIVLLAFAFLVISIPCAYVAALVLELVKGLLGL